MYFFATLVFFAAGGIEALLIRTQLAGPDGKVLSPEAFDQVMTMHGVTMIFLFVIPMTTGAFGNYLLPLMLGARDMAFPRLNALSFWIFLGSGVFLYAGLLLGKGPELRLVLLHAAEYEDVRPRAQRRLLCTGADLQRPRDDGGRV